MEPPKRESEEDNGNQEEAQGRGRKLLLKKKKEGVDQKYIYKDFDSIHRTKNNYEELAEDKIEKQAMMEALFDTQLWSEPYVRNPFIYVTDNDSDFSGEKGILLKDHFKKVFYINYMKYKNVIDKVVPKEFQLSYIKQQN